MREILPYIFNGVVGRKWGFITYSTQRKKKGSSFHAIYCVLLKPSIVMIYHYPLPCRMWDMKQKRCGDTKRRPSPGHFLDIMVIFFHFFQPYIYNGDFQCYIIIMYVDMIYMFDVCSWVNSMVQRATHKRHLVLCYQFFSCNNTNQQ